MDWLFKEDDYVPLRDKDSFLNKSIVSIIGVLSRIKGAYGGRKRGFMSRINPALKLASVIILIIFLSMARNFKFIIIVDEILLISIITCSIEEIKRIISLSLTAVGFSTVILLPSIFLGNRVNSLMIILKVFGTVGMVSLLSHTTKWDDITKALRRFFIPDIFIFVLDLTIRYIFVLSEMAADMLYALKLRSIGKNNDKYSSLSAIAGNLFIRSKIMGDETMSAMECRGFIGEYQSSTGFILSAIDFIYAVVITGIVITYFLTGRV